MNRVHDENYVLDGSLSPENACSLQHLLYWLSNQPGVSGSGTTGSASGNRDILFGSSGTGAILLPVSVTDVICRQTETGDTYIVFPVPCM